MPWIKFVEDPVLCGEVIQRAFKNNEIIEIPNLENDTKMMTSPKLKDALPLVKPENKTSSDWNPGDIGELLAFGPDGGYAYYKFIVVDSPFPDSLKEQFNEEN